MRQVKYKTISSSKTIGLIVPLEYKENYQTMMDFKVFHFGQAMPDDVETAHMTKKKQLPENKVPACKQFMAWAG